MKVTRNSVFDGNDLHILCLSLLMLMLMLKITSAHPPLLTMKHKSAAHVQTGAHITFQAMQHLCTA